MADTTVPVSADAATRERLASLADDYGRWLVITSENGYSVTALDLLDTDSAATRERRDEWKRLGGLTTDGEWEAVCDDHGTRLSHSVWCEDVGGYVAEEVRTASDAAFIAAARSAVPDLIAQVEALERSVLAAKITAVEAENAAMREAMRLALERGEYNGPLDALSVVAILRAALAATEETK